MTTEPNARVLERIAKMLDLMNNPAATEGEIANANEAIQRQLQDHNLTLSQVEAARESNAGPAEKREKKLTDFRAMYEYQTTLMRSLAESNFCLWHIKKVFEPHPKAPAMYYRGEYLNGRMSKHHQLVGRAVNVLVTGQTYQYLLDALRRAATDAGYDPRTTDGKRFLEGAASRLSERLDERRWQRVREADEAKAARPVGNGSGRELVLSDVYGSESDLNNDALNGYAPGTTAANRRAWHEKQERQDQQRSALIAAGVNEDEAWYRSRGYDEERAKQLATADAKSTGRGRGGRGTRGSNWTRSDEAHAKKVNSASYNAGRSAGARIGLDQQMGGADRKRLPRS